MYASTKLDEIFSSAYWMARFSPHYYDAALIAKALSIKVHLYGFTRIKRSKNGDCLTSQYTHHSSWARQWRKNRETVHIRPHFERYVATLAERECPFLPLPGLAQLVSEAKLASMAAFILPMDNNRKTACFKGEPSIWQPFEELVCLPDH